MTRLLYDLAAADPDLRFSPFCWRTKLALAHKNLSYETIPWRFTEKEAIGFSGQDKVPVLVDGGKVVSDSQKIAAYLEAAYPNEPPLYGDPPAQALTGYIKAWTEKALHPVLMRILAPDIHAKLDARDQAYFRRSREARLGCTLEELAATRGQSVAILQSTLAPLPALLGEQEFIAGEMPNYADHIVFGALQWARLTSSTPLFPADSLITSWMEAVLRTYGL